MKQIEANILGYSYILGCPHDGESELREAINLVDLEMSTIRNSGKVKSRERIAVLAALNLAFHLVEDGSKLSRPPASEHGAMNSWAYEPSGEKVAELIRRIDLLLSPDEKMN
ncbi:MAG: cell division protein ZapA [Burkholderiales bacterium]|jgi:cell division protein ZapA